MNTRKLLFAVGIAVGLMISGCAANQPEASPTPVDLGGVVAGTLTALASSVTETAPPATPSPTPEPADLWNCFTCSGDQIWQLGPGEPHQITLPRPLGQYYGTSAQTQRILMASVFGDHGAGPGHVAVSDLSVLDLATAEVVQLIPDNVVEAAWAPDGMALAYILATPSTYELHWRTSDGQDLLLASDVSFTWSIAPSGSAVAFSRETGYGLSASPGLFVVSVPGAQIVQVSDADKHGTGSLGDVPVWSPDSRELLLSLWGGPDTRLVLARADGSLTFDLAPDPAAAGQWWSGMQIPGAVWFPDGEHVLLNSSDINPAHGAMMGGPTALVVYRIDRQAHSLADGRLVGEATGLIDWNVIGESVWILGDDGQVESLSIPQAP